MPCPGPTAGLLPRPRCLAPAAALLLLASCGADAPAPRTVAERMDDAVVWEERFSLEESDAVVNVAPRVSLDPAGGFLVADEREAQIRRYSAAGGMLWHTGRRGGGPGEFEAPAAAVRLGSGRVVALDRDGRLTTYDSAGAAVVATLRTPFRHVSDADVVRDSLLLLAAIRDDDRDGPRLHLLHPATGAVHASYFAPFPGSPNPVAATIAGWTRASLRGDTVAAVFATGDTVHLFTVDGRPLGRIPLPAAHFRRVPAGGPPSGGGPEEGRRWFATFDYVDDVHWLADGRLVVPYQSIRPGTRGERRWNLLAMSRRGERLVEVRDAPRLLEVDPREPVLYFVDPASEVPSGWARARLRP